MKIWTGALIHTFVQLSLLSAAHADIYAFSEEDGTVVLSNLRMNRRSVVLIRDETAQTGQTGALPASTGLLGKLKKAEYQQAVLDVARSYGVDSALLHAVISVESRYSAKAVSNKGAVGLMQLMPGTAKRYGVADSFDPIQNLQGGTQYLRDLLKMFQGDLNLALAAYNAGENAVIRAGHRIPPYEETKNYVQRVQSLYAEFKSRQGPE